MWRAEYATMHLIDIWPRNCNSKPLGGDGMGKSEAALARDFILGMACLVDVCVDI